MFFFTEICNVLTKHINDWGDNYRIVSLEGKCIIVEVNGQNYLQVDSAQSISFHDLFPRTKHQKAIFNCSPNPNGLYSLFKNGKEVLCEKNFSCEMLITTVFGDIENILQNRQKIVELLGNLMNRCILPDELGYDISNQTYHFIDWNKTRGTEYLWFCNYFRNLKERGNKPFPYDNWYVAKYTSLDTALKVLNSGKMRIMSVTAMNDKWEIGHLYGELRMEDSAYLENKTKVHYARQRYITSFTDKIDDLTMWRLYGDNAKGVCLVFSEPYECDYYLPVDYSGVN